MNLGKLMYYSFL